MPVLFCLDEGKGGLVAVWEGFLFMRSEDGN
jgi:hypothetical protein